MDENTKEEKDQVLKDFLKQCGARPTSPGLSAMLMSFSVVFLLCVCGLVSFSVGLLRGARRLVARREQPRQGRALTHAARHARRARPGDQGLWPPPAYTGKAAHEERQHRHRKGFGPLASGRPCGSEQLALEAPSGGGSEQSSGSWQTQTWWSWRSWQYRTWWSRE